MIEIGRTIVSLDVLEEHFLCDLQRCKGACCVEGDSGAPLSAGEAEAIEKDYHEFEGYLPEHHKEEILKQGYSVVDSDGDVVTPLVGNRQCVYSFYEDMSSGQIAPRGVNEGTHQTGLQAADKKQSNDPTRNKILKCSIEKAFFEGKTTFRKPVSCHLFPIRITNYKRFDAVNYQQLDICKAGRECGRANRLPLYQFLKEPLIRKYGEEWYAQLEEAAKFMHKKQ